jgi:RNA polymerase sigma factor (sigma-70 family)
MSSSLSDRDLLQSYAATGSQEAFATLVRRHLDLVYSAARRQVRSPELAEEITQTVFVDLSRAAGTIPAATPLAAWLYVVTRRTAVDAIRRESRRQVREHAAYEIAAMNSPHPDWPRVEPLLDEAMESLDADARSAVLLRYFENKSLREVGEALGTSDDTAQKRVSRAVDQLRAFFLKRGVAVTATGLTTNLSAHAIQSAPAALGASLTTLAGLTATASQATVIETSKALAMTTLQKAALGAAFTLLAGGLLFETAQIHRQRDTAADLQRQNQTLTSQLRQLEAQQAAALHQLDEARQTLAALRSNPAPSASASDVSLESAIQTLTARFNRLKRVAAERPELTIPEFGLLNEQDWYTQVQRVKADSDDETGLFFRNLRSQAKVRFSIGLADAMLNYVRANQGLLPTSPRDLLSYFSPAFSEAYGYAHAPAAAMLDRYELLYSGAHSDVPPGERSRELVEITSPDEEQDQRIQVGAGGAGVRNFRDLTADARYALSAFARSHNGATPESAAQLVPYFKPALSEARREKFLQSGVSPTP